MQQTPKSRILIVHPIDPNKIEFGADVVPNIQKAKEKSNPYSCILINLTNENKSDVFSYMDQMLFNHPNIQFIIILNNIEKNDVINLVQRKNIFKILKSFDLNKITQEILYAIDKFDQQQQNKVLFNLINEQNVQLDEASKNLEQAVKKRQIYLQKSKSKLETTNQTFRLLKNALIAIHKSQSIADMEHNLFQVLSKNIQITWIRIFYKNQEQFINQFIKSQSHLNINKQNLMSFSKIIGWCVYATEEPVRPNEEEFFENLSNALGLAIDKLMKLDQLENLMNQWGSTFNSISQSIALVNHQFQIIQTNHNFDTNALVRQKNSNLNCFQIFLNDDILEKFDLNKNSQYTYNNVLDSNNVLNYEITVQSVSSKPKNSSIYLVIFRNITEEIKMENYLIQSSKMTELGTISSSIAHELNNPLGGILSFLQLIKMDMDDSHKYYEDVSEMEKAALRSKDIVRNLLGFSRYQSGSPSEPFILKESIENALKILELQTRSKGVSIESSLQDCVIEIYGHKNQFTQAVVNIIQNSLDAVLINLEENPGSDGLIRIETKAAEDNQVEVTITDNGPGIEKKYLNKVFNPLFTTKKKGAGLGLTVVYQILTQHNAHIEIFSQLQAGTSVKILIRTKS